MAHLCTLMGFRHSPRTAYCPWTNGLVEVQNRKLSTHLRMFLQDTPKVWAFHVHMFAYAHNSQPLSELNISPQEIVFYTRSRIPLTFDINLNRNTSKQCIPKYCSQLPAHSHYDITDLNPFFYKILSKPNPHWFLAVVTAMLQIYSTVREDTLKKLTPQLTSPKHSTKVNHSLLADLFLNAILHTYIFLTNLNYFGLVLIKFSKDYLTLNTNFLHKMDLHYMSIEVIQSPSTQKNHSYTHIYVVSCVSPTQPNLTFQNQLNMQIVPLPHLIPMNPCQTKTYHHNLLTLLPTQITILRLLPPMITHLSNWMTTHLSKR